MAGASINDIKSRIKSVEGTMQITKAMELVATSKLRHAKARAENAKPYLSVLKDAIASLATDGANANGKTLIIVIAGDRGLAGGYNSNIFKLLGTVGGENTVYLPIGKKAIDHSSKKALELFPVPSTAAGDVTVGTALSLAEVIAEELARGNIGEIKIVYTKFVSMLTQTPVCEKVYPIEAVGGDSTEPLLEDDKDAILKRILPQYIGGFIYGAVAESFASECASRRAAMNSANKNAEEMIGTLVLQFNRARQAVITQEITEIVSGAEAL